MHGQLSATLVVILAALSGCNRAYVLPGHRESNLSHPPDIVMQIGKREEAIADGIFWWPLGVVNAPWSDSVIKSENPEVVSFERSGDRSGALVAHAVGTARLYYYPGRLDANRGFLVWVEPAK